MATRRTEPTTRRRKRTTRKPQTNTLMTDLTRVADDSKDYVVKYSTQARDYLAKHPALAVAAGAVVIAGAFASRRLWLPAVAIAAVERYMPDLPLPTVNQVVGQLKSLKPSFMG